MLGQFGPGAMEPGLDGADRPIAALGDLFIGQILFVVESEDQSVLGTKPVDRLFQFAGEIIGIVDPGPRVGMVLGRGDRGELGPPHSQGQRRAATVGGNLQQPGADGTGSVEAEYRPQSAQKRLLGHVLGVLPVVQHPVAEAEDDAVKTLNQQASRLGISRPDCLDQRGVVHRHGQLARPTQWPPPTRRSAPHTSAAILSFQDSPPTRNYSDNSQRAGRKQTTIRGGQESRRPDRRGWSCSEGELAGCVRENVGQGWSGLCSWLLCHIDPFGCQQGSQFLRGKILERAPLLVEAGFEPQGDLVQLGRVDPPGQFGQLERIEVAESLPCRSSSISISKTISWSWAWVSAEPPNTRDWSLRVNR